VEDEYFGDHSSYFALELANHALVLAVSNPETNFLRMKIELPEGIQTQSEELVIQLD
jgi:hypothetical protein